MKQKLLDFLGDYAETYCSRIEEVYDGLYVFGSGDFFSMNAIDSLIEFARSNELHYYVSARLNAVFFRLYTTD